MRDPRPRGLDEDVTPLRHAVREIRVLTEGIVVEILVEALLREDLPSKRHEPADERLDAACVGGGRAHVREEAGPHTATRLGPPRLHPEEPEPEDRCAPRGRRLEPGAAPSA